MTNNLDLSNDSAQLDMSLIAFPDYELDWQDIMSNVENYWIPDQMKLTDSPDNSVPPTEIYQERVIYAIKRIKSYPKQFVAHGSTPFIHRMLYSNFLPPVIQDILGVCALYTQKQECNQQLVYRILSQKASALIESYNPEKLSPMEHLASVQALILYQVIRLFDGDIRQRADAERTDPILHVWTEQLKLRMEVVSRFSDDHHALQIMNFTREVWRNWIFAESIRRTVIISFSIQSMYCFLKNGWDAYHHDILPLTFYGQRALWDATSAQHWLSARKELAALPICLESWDADIREAKPSDMDDLGIMILVLIKGFHECAQWVGNENLDRFGLHTT